MCELKWIVILNMLCLSPQVMAANSGMGLIDALKKAEDSSPRLQNARLREDAAVAGISIQKARHFPELSLGAVASTGKPGVFSMLDVDSDLSSSQRLGYGGALVFKQNIWDFGRTTNAVREASEQQSLRKAEYLIAKSEIGIAVLQTYIRCAHLRSHLKNLEFMAEQARLLAKETDRFVRSGQRSIVERYLVDAGVQEADTLIAEFNERLATTEERLAIEIGLPGKVECRDLSGIEPALSTLESQKESSPLLDEQIAKVRMAEARLARAKSDYRPLIYGMLTGGVFENDHLRDKTNYGAGIGIQLPLFEGFRTDASVQETAAESHAQQAEEAASRQQLSARNSSYDEQIRSLRVRLDFLEKEKKLGKEVFALAKKRYLSLQGSMIDLRESIKNMERVLQSTDEANRDLSLARAEKAVLNGALNTLLN